MRILIGFPNHIPQLERRSPLPGRERQEDDILCFGREYHRVAYEPGVTWGELRAACPRGWLPDVYIHWSPEYNPVPRGLETAECLTVGVFGDWNLGGHTVHNCGDMFDLLVADRNGCEMLRRAGFPNVLHAQLWAYDPQRHYRLSGVGDADRDIDILMLGNFNHAIQERRAYWLARIARLSRKYRVLLATGVHGEEYTRMLNRAKIVFNYAIRGEINMRAYEAPACGALLFNEAANAEIRDLYTDGEHCILYDENNLEALLDYYLAPEHAAERERIAAAGRQRVQPHTYARHLADLLDQIEPLLQVWRDQGQRPQRGFERDTPHRQRVRLAAQWIKSCDTRVYPLADALLQREMESARGDARRELAEVANIRAALAGEWAKCLTEVPQRERAFHNAIALAEHAMRLDGDLVAAQFNLAFFKLALGRAEEAEALLTAYLTALESPILQPWQLTGPYFPRAFAAFDVTLDRVWGQSAPGSEAWAAQVRDIVACHVYATLAELRYTRHDWNAAISHACKAVALRPELGELHWLLARALRASGQAQEAIASYQRALERLPFIPLAQEELAQLLLDVSRPQSAVAVLENWLTIIAGMPMYEPLRPDLETMLHSARVQAQQPPASGSAPFRRLLAFPDWRDADDWQALVRAFASNYGPEDAVLLMLRADPTDFPATDRLMQALGSYLMQQLRLEPSELPNITLLNQPLAPADRWKLFHVADALIATTHLSAGCLQQAQAASVPLLDQGFRVLGD